MAARTWGCVSGEGEAVSISLVNTDYTLHCNSGLLTEKDAGKRGTRGEEDGAFASFVKIVGRVRSGFGARMWTFDGIYAAVELTRSQRYPSATSTLGSRVILKCSVGRYRWI